MFNEKDLEFASALRNALTRLIKKLRKESPTGLQLSLTERSTMSLLYQHKALLPSELAAMEMITNQSMSQVLNHLFDLGYITRTSSQSDKRKINISLSENGEEVLLQFRHERDEWLAKAIAETFTTEEKEQVGKLIVPLNKLIDYK